MARPSFDGGAATAALGLLLHYFIAISMAFTYYLAAQRWALLRDRPVAAGAAYGVLLYIIMNDVVVPLSRATPSAKDVIWVGLSVAVLASLIGVPIAIFARRALTAATRDSTPLAR